MACFKGLRFIGVGVLALSALISNGAAAEPSAQPSALAPGLFWLQGQHRAGAQPDGNSVLLKGERGWVLIDSGRHRAHTQALLDFLAQQQAGPELFVINSHWHLDHLGGNALLRRARPELRAYASAAVASALNGWLANYRRELEQLQAGGELDEAGRRQVEIDLALLRDAAALQPDEFLQSPPQALNLAGRALRVGVLGDAVSGGDVWVLDLASATLISGDLLTLPVPFLDTACPQGWLQALDQLAEQPFERLIPGHGPVLSRADFMRYREAYARLLQCAASDTAEVACGEAWLAAVGPWVAESERPRARQMLHYYFDSSLRTERAAARFCNGA